MEAAATPASSPADETAAPTGTMRAAVHARFGAPADAIEITDVAIPTPAADEVLIAVEASGIAIGDWLTVTGQPYIARPMYGIRTPKERVAGFEAAGTVVAVGADVARFAVGDEVFGHGTGTLAQYVALAQDAVVHRPAEVSANAAAAVPISAIAALQALRDSAGVTEGDRVLVVGASGAVGTFAIQIAKAFGAEVTGVAGTRNVELLRSIGADHVIDYTKDDFATGPDRYDAIINLAGNRSVKDLRSVLAPTGTLVMVGGSGGSWTMGYGTTIRALVRNLFTKQTLATLISKPNAEDLSVLADMLAAGDITPAIDRTFGLDETIDALEHVGSRHTSGKSIVTV